MAETLVERKNNLRRFIEIFEWALKKMETIHASDMEMMDNRSATEKVTSFFWWLEILHICLNGIQCDSDFAECRQAEAV